MPKAPKTRCHGEWTEKRFWGFIRSSLRRASMRWAPLVKHVYERSRRENQSGNKRLKWEFRCSGCGRWYPRKEIEADHIVPVGSLTSAEDLPGFVSRLFCEVEGLRLLCKGCHARRTARDK